MTDNGLIRTDKGELEIGREEIMTESPRDWDNTAKFSLYHPDYDFPQEHGKSEENLSGILDNLSETEYIFPVIMYDHGEVRFSLDNAYPFDCLWDTMSVGVITVNKQDCANEAEARKIALSELKTFEQWFNGEVYYVVYDNYLTGETRVISGIYAYSYDDLIEKAIEHVIPADNAAAIREAA